MITRLTLLAALLVAAGCDDTSKGSTADDTWVTAMIDGEPYEGGSQGAVWSGAGDGTLTLFPADAISGALLSWQPGDTGEWSMIGVDDDAELELFYFDEAMTQYVGVSGAFSIDTWEPYDPDATDPRIGFITGGFAGTFQDVYGADTVEVTDGSYGVMVTDNSTGATR